MEKFLYHSNDETFPDTKEGLVCFIGFSENCGDALTFYFLAENEKTMSKNVGCPYKSEENLTISLGQKEQKGTVHVLGKILHTPE